MRFKKSPQLPGAGRTREWHHHRSHTPTSPWAILQVKWPVNPNILAASVHTIAFSEDPQWVAINSKGAFLSYFIINILKYIYTRSDIHSSYILCRDVTTKLSLISSNPKKIESKFVLESCTLFNGIHDPCRAKFSPRKPPISQFIPNKVALF